MNYGLRLKDLRDENNLSQNEVAEKLGIKRSSYNQFEQQYDIIPIKRLVELAIIFNCSVDYLFGFTLTKNYDSNTSNINKEISCLRLKEFRKENMLTQNKLASILSTTQSNIAEYERGTNIIATPYLYMICKKYRISADYLLGRIDEPKYLQ